VVFHLLDIGLSITEKEIKNTQNLSILSVLFLKVWK